MGSDASLAEKKAAEKKRLAEALRANLRRRKVGRPGHSQGLVDAPPTTAPQSASDSDH